MIRLLEINLTQPDKGVRGKEKRRQFAADKGSNAHQCCIVRALCFASIGGKSIYLGFVSIQAVMQFIPSVLFEKQFSFTEINNIGEKSNNQHNN